MRDEFQIRYSQKKLDLAKLPYHLRESLDIRARGGSKTFDQMEIALYLASIGFVGIWFAAVAKQMEQPKKYLKYIIERSYLKYLINPGDLLKESVFFKTGGELRIYNLTEDNARSPRVDFVIYDEEARADRDAYNAGSSIVSNSLLGLVFHISTACKATIFEENYDRIKLREIVNEEQFIFTRCWDEISFLLRKKEWYEEQKRIQPGWYFRQEHECSFELPMGAVFQNVVYDVYDLIDNKWILKLPLILDTRIVSGIDWNPVSGHWCVGGQWLENGLGFVVTHAVPIAVGYSYKLMEEAYIEVKQWCINRKRLCMESGGINEEFVSWFKDWIGKDKSKRDMYVLYEEWDSANINKTNAVLSMLDKTIYVDRIRFPKLAKQIEDCQWDRDATEPKLDKDPVDSPHALDAFLHAINKRLLKDISMKRFDWYGST